MSHTAVHSKSSRQAVRPRTRPILAVVTLLVTIGLAGPAPVTAQADGGPEEVVSGWWLGVSLGFGALPGGGQDDDTALALAGEVALLDGRDLWTLRGSVAVELFDQSLWDLGVLYGRSAGGPGAHQSFSAGLALVGAEDCPGIFDTGPCEERTTIGVPFLARASLELGRALGVGLEVSGNLNPVQSFVAIGLGLRVGDLR